MTMLLLVTFVFLTLSLPVRGLVFYVNFSRGNTPFYYAGLNLFYQVGTNSYYSNHGVNFFLYVISGQKFRGDLRRLFMSKKQNDENGTESDISIITSACSVKKGSGIDTFF